MNKLYLDCDMYPLLYLHAKIDSLSGLLHNLCKTYIFWQTSQIGLFVIDCMMKNDMFDCVSM